MERACWLAQVVAVFAAFCPWLASGASLCPPNGRILAPLNVEAVEITCEVRTGATPQWKIKTHDLVNPVEGINITTTANVSVLVADRMGLDKFGEVEGSSILNVSCVPSNKRCVGPMGASEQRCLIVRYGAPGRPHDIRVNRESDRIHWKPPHNMNKEVPISYIVTLEDMAAGTKPVMYNVTKTSLQILHIPRCFAVKIIAVNLAGESEPAYKSISPHSPACMANVRSATMEYVPHSPDHVSVGCELEEWSPARACYMSNGTSSFTVPQEGLCLQKEELERGRWQAYGAEENGEQIGTAVNVTLVEPTTGSTTCSSSSLVPLVTVMAFAVVSAALAA